MSRLTRAASRRCEARRSTALSKRNRWRIRHSRKLINPDATLHLDGEEDTLYDDGLEIDDDSAGPLTGKDGRDDTQ